MPGTICVKRENRSYCLNFETGQVDVFTKESLPVKACPEDIARDLLALLSERMKDEQHIAIGG